MAKITVVAKIDGGCHLKYGHIRQGDSYSIDEEDFGAELFERPDPEWLSPLERADRERAAALDMPVGSQNPPAENTEEEGH